LDSTPISQLNERPVLPFHAIRFRLGYSAAAILGRAHGARYGFRVEDTIYINPTALYLDGPSVEIA
jgi:hypothetical protein